MHCTHGKDDGNPDISFIHLVLLNENLSLLFIPLALRVRFTFPLSFMNPRYSNNPIFISGSAGGELDPDPGVCQNLVLLLTTLPHSKFLNINELTFVLLFYPQAD